MVSSLSELDGDLHVFQGGYGGGPEVRGIDTLANCFKNFSGLLDLLGKMLIGHSDFSVN